MIDRAILEAAAEAISSAESLALACHVGPDGDALGSMLGLGIAAENAGKKVVASFGTPFGVAAGFAFLPTALLVSPQDFPAEPQTMIVFDAASLDRLGELAENASKAGTTIVIDHHATNGGFGDIAVVDGAAAATGELVALLLRTLGWPLTPEIATCLLTAIVTDTGRFQYANTSPSTLELAAELVAAGARPPEISRHIYEEVPFGYLKAAGAALSRAELDKDKGLVTAVITHADLDEAGIDWGDIDNLVDTVRLAVEADVAVLAKVHADGKVKLSLRSRGATDVGSLAAELGGGGHRLAAGATFVGDAKDALDEVRKRIEDFR
ncbi:MAG TPA: bifunctional oligoribonuclease/PAP phosphatase NrnA [Acidimicrobiia bacterium]|nr:bifunctional oligoribonuclease/PAP phosphatase NrnA [Acidimicrobiia bacterium]